MPGHGRVHTSSPTAPRSGWPRSSNTSTAMPRLGPPSDIGLIGYEMTLLVDRVGQLLTPELRSELQGSFGR